MCSSAKWREGKSSGARESCIVQRQNISNSLLGSFHTSCLGEGSRFQQEAGVPSCLHCSQGIQEFCRAAVGGDAKMRLREDQWIPVEFLGARVLPARGAPQSLGMFKLLPKSGEKWKRPFCWENPTADFFLLHVFISIKMPPGSDTNLLCSLAATAVGLQVHSHFSPTSGHVTIGLVDNLSWKTRGAGGFWKVSGRSPCLSRSKQSNAILPWTALPQKHILIPPCSAWDGLGLQTTF